MDQHEAHAEAIRSNNLLLKGTYEDGYKAGFKAGREAGMREASEIVPSNWLDPLLTGPEGLGSTPWDGETIERLLLGVRAAILSAIVGNK